MIDINGEMLAKWNTLYDDTLRIFPHTKYYSAYMFDLRFVNKKSQFVKYFDFIQESYTKHRHYHTLNHVNEVLDALHFFKLSDEDNLVLRYAIWFHDIVYDATKTSNESKSAEELNDFVIHFGLEKHFSKDASRLIIESDHKTPITSRLGKIMCDCDLKEFIADNYIERSNQVKEEYSHLSDEEWKQGRMEFLAYMLNRQIYQTSIFRNKFEDKAKENLEAELNYFING